MDQSGEHLLSEVQAMVLAQVAQVIRIGLHMVTVDVMFVGRQNLNNWIKLKKFPNSGQMQQQGILIQGHSVRTFSAPCIV